MVERAGHVVQNSACRTRCVDARVKLGKTGEGAKMSQNDPYTHTHHNTPPPTPYCIYTSLLSSPHVVLDNMEVTHNGGL